MTGIGFTDRSGLQPETKVDRLRPIELQLSLVETREKAVLVRDASGHTAWLQRRYIKIEEGMFNAVRVTLPTWLAIEKGLRTAPSPEQKTLF